MLKLLLSIIRIPILAVGKIAGRIYSLLLGSRDRRLAKENQARLAIDVRRFFPYLFSEHSARLFEEDPFTPPPLDYASVRVEVEHIVLYFSRGGGESSIDIAPIHSPRDVYPLAWVLSAISKVEHRSLLDSVDLFRLAQELRRCFSSLLEAYSKDGYTDIKVELSRTAHVNRQTTEQLQSSIEKRLS